MSRITPFEDGHSALMHSTLFVMAVEVLVSLELQVRASRKLSADSENLGGGVNLLFASTSAGANRSYYGSSYTSINI